MWFVSEQAFGSKGNGEPTFKGKARRPASALLVPELTTADQLLPAQAGSPRARTLEPENRTTSASITH